MTGLSTDRRTEPTLSDVAGRLTPLLGAVAVPLQLSGVVLGAGIGRWFFAVMSLVCLGSVFSKNSAEMQARRPLAMAVTTIGTSALTAVMWVGFVPDGATLVVAAL